ncbi:MAG TPA: DUF1598 domain-containing protein [Pirellulales bacterium]|nr:DUF1598 domain-containing protein [Pirellulales bacterium]
MRRYAVSRVTKLLLAASAIMAASVATTPAWAQFGVSQQVGGVWVDADGVLRNRQVDETDRVRAARAAMLHPQAADARTFGPRKISLRRLEAAIADHLKTGQPLDDEMKYLAGLQHIQYVFVYPELGDIVLAGPGEGWKINRDGDLVGLTTGRPVMWLDDLLVALRTAEATRQTGVSCSIDPTNEGVVRVNALLDKMARDGYGTNPDDLEEGMHAVEETLGPQMVSIKGIPADSHFARVIVAADYQMKRLAMNFDTSPVKGLPSYLQMMKTGGGGSKNLMQRWWLEPNYQALLVSPDELAFEIRGASVKAMTEEDFVTVNGSRKRSGKANPLARKWADNMTAHYDELAAKNAIFGQLRNCIDLAVVSALIVKDRLPEKANYSMSVFLHDDQLVTEKFNQPKQIATQASLLQKGTSWLISASGGVQMYCWQLAEKAETSADLAPERQKTVLPPDGRWWWN